MSSRQETGSGAGHGFFFHPLANTLTGFVFALILSATIIVASNIPPLAGPFLAIKRLGIDLGMTIHAELYAPARRTGRSGAPEPRLVFLDIGQAACDAYFAPTNATERCRAGHPAQPELVHGVLAGALGGPARPAAVIVDAALVNLKAAPDWPRPGQLPLRSERTPVIYAVVGRVADEPRTVWLDASEDSVRKRVLDGAHLAVAQTFIEAEDGDDVLRRYAPALVVRPAGDGARALTPTVAMAAAVAAAEGPAGLARIADEFPRGGAAGCDAARAHGPGVHGQSEHGQGAHGTAARYGFDTRLVCLSALTPGIAQAPPARVPELLFTLRSLAYPRDGSAPPSGITASIEDDIDRAAYLRVPVNDLAQLRPASLARFLDGAVVVIGTSAASARDVHATPVGTMAGAEVVLNAVRAFLSFPVAGHPTLAAELLHESLLVGIASAIFFVVWCLIELLSGRIKGAARPWALVLRAGIGAIFVGGIAVIAMALPLFETVFSLPRVSVGLPPPDILTPIFALSLEGFAKAARWFLDLIHAGVDAFLERAWPSVGPGR